MPKLRSNSVFVGRDSKQFPPKHAKDAQGNRLLLFRVFRVFRGKSHGFASSTACTGMELPKFFQSLNVQTTLLSGVISRNCGLSGPAWQLPNRVWPLGKRSTRVTQAMVMPGRSFCSTFHT